MMKPYILLIQDDPDDVELTKSGFAGTRLANDIAVFEDGAQACAFLFDRDCDGRGLPELILLALKPNDPAGAEILERLRRDPRTRPIPTVVLTAGQNEGLDRSLLRRFSGPK